MYQGNSILGFSGILAQMTAKVTATPANVGNWQKSHKMVRKSNNLLRICILIFLYIARGPKSSLSVFPSVEGSKNETRDSLCWMRRRRFVHWWCYCVHSLSCCVLPLTCHEAAKTMIQPFPYHTLMQNLNFCPKIQFWWNLLHFEFEFSRRKWEYWGLDFMNKNPDFATVCIPTRGGIVLAW